LHEITHRFFQPALIVLALGHPAFRIDNQLGILGMAQDQIEVSAEVFPLFIKKVIDDFQDRPRARIWFPASLLGRNAQGKNADALYIIG
jgi:hypothetical protein